MTLRSRLMNAHFIGKKFITLSHEYLLLSSARNFYSKILISIIGVKMKLRIIPKKYVVALTQQFPKKSI